MMKSQSGQSIVQVLVSIGIMGILMMTFVSMMTNQSRETRALNEKLSTIDTYRSLEYVINNSTTCFNMLQAGNIISGSTTFDITSAANPIGTIQLRQVTEASGAAIVRIGEALSTSASVIPTSIQFNITSPTTASLVLAFDNNQMVRSLRPFPISNIAIYTTPTGTPNQVQITGCDSTGLALAGGGSPSGWTCTVRQSAAGPIVTASCLSNEKLVSGGCDMGMVGYPKNQGWHCEKFSFPPSVTAYANCCQ